MSNTTRLPRRAGLAAVVVTSVAAPAILAEPAAARHPRDTCPGNTLCEWRDTNFNLPVQWWSPNGSDNTYGNNTYSSGPSVGLNDSISSVWNNSNRWVKLCQNAGCGGPYSPWGLCVAPGGAAANLAVGGSYGGAPLDNEMSSHYTYPSKPDYCFTTITQQGCSI